MVKSVWWYLALNAQTCPLALKSVQKQSILSKTVIFFYDLIYNWRKIYYCEKLKVYIYISLCMLLYKMQMLASFEYESLRNKCKVNLIIENIVSIHKKGTKYTKYFKCNTLFNIWMIECTIIILSMFEYVNSCKPISSVWKACRKVLVYKQLRDKYFLIRGSNSARSL